MVRIIHFANDTPLAEVGEGHHLEVDATALGLADGSPCPDQILVNGYSYTYAGGMPEFLLYRRDHDKKDLWVLLK